MKTPISASHPQNPFWIQHDCVLPILVFLLWRIDFIQRLESGGVDLANSRYVLESIISIAAGFRGRAKTKVSALREDHAGSDPSRSAIALQQQELFVVVQCSSPSEAVLQLTGADRDLESRLQRRRGEHRLRSKRRQLQLLRLCRRGVSGIERLRFAREFDWAKRRGGGDKLLRDLRWGSSKRDKFNSPPGGGQRPFLGKPEDWSPGQR